MAGEPQIGAEAGLHAQRLHVEIPRGIDVVREYEIVLDLGQGHGANSCGANVRRLLHQVLFNCDCRGQGGGFAWIPSRTAATSHWVTRSRTTWTRRGTRWLTRWTTPRT